MCFKYLADLKEPPLSRSRLGSLFCNLNNTLSCMVEVIVKEYSQLLLSWLNHLSCNFGVGSLESKYYRLGKRYLFSCRDDRLSKIIASKDASENVDEDGMDFRVVV